MEGVCALEKQLLLGDLLGQLVGAPASLLIQTADEVHHEFRRTDMFHRQQILTHSDGITNTKTALRLEPDYGLLRRNPIGARIQPSVVSNQISVVGQRKRRKPEASSGCRFESPAREQSVELIVDVGVANDVAAGVGKQCAFYCPDLFFYALFGILKTKKCEQFLVLTLADGLVQLAHLTESFR